MTGMKLRLHSLRTRERQWQLPQCALREKFVPVDHAIVGIVDAVEADGR